MILLFYEQTAFTINATTTNPNSEETEPLKLHVINEIRMLFCKYLFSKRVYNYPLILNQQAKLY